MAEQTAAAANVGGGFRIPASAQDIWALVLSLLTVLVLVQIGAPLIRELEFLDPKLRDYFIGISFAAFPLIHRQCKNGLSGITVKPEVHVDLTPWYVSGAIAGALLFAWNQFVSGCAGFAIGVLHAQIPVGQIDDNAFMEALGISLLAMSIPMSAFASVFAGILLNRYARSHVFLALGTAAVLYLAFNISLNFALQPEFISAQISNAVAQGPAGVIGFVVGMGLVALVVLIFGAIGVAISRINRERSLGRIIDGARHLPPAERDLVAAEISRRLTAKIQQPGSEAPPPAAFVAAPVVPASPPQMPTAAEP
jgi:hypothetical protein